MQSNLVNKTLTGLYNGVSQQPPSIRLESQAERQINCSSELVDGVTRRAHTEYVTSLIGSNADIFSRYHTIERDADERYKLIFTGDPTEPLEVYDLDTGQKGTVSFDANTKNYLLYEDDDTTTIFPKADLEMVTVADYTIIANSKRHPKMKASTITQGNPQGMVYVKRGFPEINHDVDVYEGNTLVGSASYTTPAPSSSGVTTSPTDTIATELRNQLNTSLGAAYTVTTMGSVVVIENTNGTSFTIKTNDSYGNQALVPIVTSVQEFSDLPPVAPIGTTLKVEGDSDNSFDNFYVKYQEDENGTGIWTETTAIYDENGDPIKNEIDPATMPHRLIRTGINTFELKQIGWANRFVGDNISAPIPSFIGESINDIFFYRNRLGFLAGQNVLLSRASEYFNFFPNTATDVIDSDPIDVAVASQQVASLQKAIAFANQLLVFSEQKQFISGGRGTVNPSTFSLETSTYFRANTNVAPVGAGQNIYFVVPNGEYSSIREYYVQTDTKMTNADNVTAHVPRYLPKDITKLVTATSRDILFATTSEEPQNIYVYQYYWDGNQKAQSAWSKWTFEEQILDVSVIDNYLYLFMYNGTEITIERIELENTNTDNLGFAINLDKLTEISGQYDATANKTTFTLPYSDSSGSFKFIQSSTGLAIDGVTRVAGTDEFEVAGDWTTSSVYVGKTYDSIFRFSRFYVKGRGNLAQLKGKMKIRTLSLSFQNTGIFKLTTTTDDGRSSTKNFVKAENLTQQIGTPALLSGEESFVIFTDSMNSDIEITSVAHYPFKFQSAAFEGLWTSRSQGL